MTALDANFHRWIDPSERGAVRARHKVEATADERARLAAWLGVPTIFRMTADLLVERVSTEEAAVTGAFEAELELVCGVSLEAFRETLSAPVSGRFRKPAGRAPSREEQSLGDIVVDLDTEEPGEWRPQGIDIGALVAEELSLAVPDFPRKPGAALESPAEVPDEADGKPNPFAALARLKEQSGNQS
ncbi:MAG: DUF177 domain-containing protein [Alphaproteobacteria bacterium]|nr:DUF177 domain-containing protein [Alphaproteobacteria bacterium]